MSTPLGPLTALLELQERMNQLFDELVHPVEQAGGQVVWTPVADVNASAGGFSICLDLPGIDPESVEVEVEDTSIVVRGVRSYPREVTDDVHRIERHYGAFARTFELPAPADAARIERHYRDGVLRLALTRAAPPPET